MPYSRFKCPDGNETPIVQCLHKCRIDHYFEAGRCLSLPTLRAIALSQREWKGEPSTTQLIKGTREMFYDLTTDYAVDPQGMIWAIFGTGVHSALDDYTPEECMSEERISDGTSSGSFDYFEPETGFLYDRKTYGSYKTQKLLGLKKIKIPVIDEQTGKQKKYGNGKPIFDEQWLIGHRSRLDVAIQLNDYRMKLERSGFTVNKMFVEVLTRDGGTHIAKSRGIDLNAQLVEINKISDHWISKYMKAKAKLLLDALDKKELPKVCSPREMWGGKRISVNGERVPVGGMKCKNFCSGKNVCPIGIKESV